MAEPHLGSLEHLIEEYVALYALDMQSLCLHFLVIGCHVLIYSQRKY